MWIALISLPLIHVNVVEGDLGLQSYRQDHGTYRCRYLAGDQSSSHVLLTPQT
jgi:hypothetical protein